MMAACEFDQRLGVRRRAGKHHMTARQLMKNGKTKSDTLCSLLMFYVVKRSNTSAHNACIRVESRRPPHRASETGGNSLSTFPALSSLVSDALLLLLNEGCARCIMGTEEFDDRKHFVRRPDQALTNFLCNPANSCTKHIIPCGPLTQTKTSHT